MNILSHPSITVALEANALEKNSASRHACQAEMAIVAVVMLVALADTALGSAKFVTGNVPDWTQPYTYTPVSPNGGPGPIHRASASGTAGARQVLRPIWPAIGLTSSASLLRTPTAFPISTVMWTERPSWQDYLADGTSNRPPPQAQRAHCPSQLRTSAGTWIATTAFRTIFPVLEQWWFIRPPLFRRASRYLREGHSCGPAEVSDSRYSLSGSIFWETEPRDGQVQGDTPQG